eukprot:4600373-Lingulodinium_polyedra.AAC.1
MSAARYVSKASEDCTQLYKQICKQLGDIGKEIFSAREETEDQETLTKWQAMADTASEAIKTLRAKVTNMRNFAAKAS